MSCSKDIPNIKITDCKPFVRDTKREAELFRRYQLEKEFLNKTDLNFKISEIKERINNGSLRVINQ